MRAAWMAVAIGGVMLLSVGQPWAWAGTNTWSGNGASDNGGNWSDSNNWNPTTVPGAADVAVMPTVPSGTRWVTNDVLTTVQEIDMNQASASYNNAIYLNADMNVGRLKCTTPGGSYMHNIVNVNGKTLTIGAGDYNSDPLPAFSGNGTIVKSGTGTVKLIYESTASFSGTFRVDNGIIQGTYARIGGSFLVNAGGTYYVEVGGGEDPAVTLNGTGFNSNGAFRVGPSLAKNSAITLASDSTIYVSPSQTFTYNGSLSGTGKLTKTGTGKLLIAGNSNTFSNNTTVAEGTIEVSGLFQNSSVTVKSNAVLVGPAYRLGSVTVETGGIWSNAVVAEWIKGNNYDGNDSGPWSDTNNWGTFALPTNLAILGTVTGNGNDGVATRTVTNDVVTAVGELRFLQSNGSYQNRLYLAADMSVGTLPGVNNIWDRLGIEVPAGRTFTVTNAAPEGFPNLYPSSGSAGTVIKNGAGTAKLIYSGGITWNGRYVANGGTTYLNYDRINNVTYIVNSGASLQVDSTSYAVGCTLTLNGAGYNGQGALYASGNPNGAVFVPPVTVSNGATIKVASGQTLPLVGALKGTGTTTLIGGGVLDLNNAWTFSIAGSTANGILARTGTVDIAGCTLSITNLASATAREYVVVDYNNGINSSLVGQFAATNGLTGTWYLAYTGTKANPNAVVLTFPPPRGTIVLMR